MSDSQENNTDKPSAGGNALLGSLNSMLGSAKKAASETATIARQENQTASAEKSGNAADAGNTQKPVAGSLTGGALFTVVTRNEFYRDGFRNMIKLAILEGIIIIGLIVAISLQIANSKSEDRYFATTADGRIMQLVPMDKPNMSTAALMSWVAQASSDVMTFGYHDYQRRLQQSARFFTKSGWESFTSALQKSRILDAVRAQQQVVSAVPSSAPVLVQQGVLNGKFRWIIQLPISVTYKSAENSRTDKLKLNLVVERVPSLENPNGVGIQQWIAVQE